MVVPSALMRSSRSMISLARTEASAGMASSLR
jgi:hypothetical protein